MLRVISEDGSQLGVISRREALDIARAADLDLVEVSPNANPPVCKIVDWGKYNYQQTKQAQKNKRTAKTSEIKQMRFGLKISDHDISVKSRKIQEFLDDGNKVKIMIVYRGRELAHKELGYKLADKIIALFGEKISIDQSPQFAGKQLSFQIRPNPAYKPTKQPIVEEQ